MVMSIMFIMIICLDESYRIFFTHECNTFYYHDIYHETDTAINEFLSWTKTKWNPFRVPNRTEVYFSIDYDKRERGIGRWLGW